MRYQKHFLLGLYRMMQRIRQCDEALVAPIQNGEVRCPCHLSCGQEAVAAGICAALNICDYVFSSHRSHGHFLAKGGTVRAMMAEIYGRETGCARGRGGSMHLIDPEVGMLGAAPIVAGTISLALGAALASSIRGENRVAVSFFGDGAAGEGVLYEAMNFAALRRLPIIFVCENNFYSTHLAISECRVNRDIFRIAAPLSVASAQPDGNDVLAVYEAGRKAVSDCRRGRGPVFIECLTYRFRGHVGPDDNIQGTHTDIRPKAEIRKWLRRDPIQSFAKLLLKKQSCNHSELKAADEAIQKEILDALAHAKASPYPSEKDISKYVCR